MLKLIVDLKEKHKYQECEQTKMFIADEAKRGIRRREHLTQTEHWSKYKKVLTLIQPRG